jgi:biopolymer transport protein TolR
MASNIPRRRKPMSQINVVPYIDVMLVLLVIFMVTAPMLQQGVQVDLPKVAANPLDNQKPEDLIVVTVDKEGRFSLDSGTFLDDDALRAAVAERLASRKQNEAYVRGDRAIDYGRVVQAMVILQDAGVEKVGLITDPLPDE